MPCLGTVRTESEPATFFVVKAQWKDGQIAIVHLPVAGKFFMSSYESQSMPRCTVYFDGGCPLCSREIATYQQARGGNEINWVDASQCDANQLAFGLDRSNALKRLHVRGADGVLLSGAAAFVEIWRRLPAFAGIARLCSNRYALALLEFAYERFLVMRRLWRKA